MERPAWMLYGAYGYTGRLIAAEAVRRGHQPLLGGRDPRRLRLVAKELGLRSVEVEVDEIEGPLSRLADGGLVLNAAGPFVRTAQPVLDACLRAGVSYLDLTGEVPVIEDLFRRHREVRDRGIAAVPAVGFDVVPTDSLAQRLRDTLGAGFLLELAFQSPGGPSRGTLRTILEQIPMGSLRRRGGVLIHGRLGEGGRTIPFPDGDRYAIPIPWGDLATAYRTIGAVDIVTYMCVPRGKARRLRTVAPMLGRILSVPPFLRAIQRIAPALSRGPDEKKRAEGRSRIWGRLETQDGRAAWGSVTVQEGYRFTAASAVRAVERTLEGLKPGVQTPTQAFGTGFLEEIPETEVIGPFTEGVPRR